MHWIRTLGAWSAFRQSGEVLLSLMAKLGIVPSFFPLGLHHMNEAYIRVPLILILGIAGLEGSRG